MNNALDIALDTSLNIVLGKLVAEDLCCSRPRHSKIDEMDLTGEVKSETENKVIGVSKYATPAKIASLLFF